MFEQKRNEVMWGLWPEYAKVLGNLDTVAACEIPTIDFIKKLAKTLLPDKLVTVGEPQEQKLIEESKEPLKIAADAREENSFVNQVTAEAVKYEEES